MLTGLNAETADAAPPRGLARWADHKVVGLLYALTALLFLFLGFCLVLLMRWQAAYPEQPVPLAGAWLDPNHPWMPGGVLLPDFYNQLGAMHGSIMIFFGVAPLLVGGFGLYLVPLMVGAPNAAFPRLGLLSYVMYLAGGLVVLASFFTRGGPANTGWTAYPPLSVIEHAGQTYWLAGMLLVYGSNLLLAVTLITTIVQMRAPGMHFMRMPFFVWSQLVTAFLLLLAFPSLAVASVFQLMDRTLGTSFFMPTGLVVGGEELAISGGGSALLWQHLFWFLAHPEVYVLILPALGIVAEIIANNTRKPLWGYRGMVYATWFLGLMSMLVWAHHMFLTGMGAAMNAFFQLTTIIVSVPSIVVAVSLLLSLWGGAIRFTTPMLFALAFLPMFGIGGLTGIPLAFAATNVALHDTEFVVGHFHYVVAPGTLFAIFAGVHYWFPKVTGRRMNDALARWHFGLSLLFMNGVFFPMLIKGVAGVNRRLYDGGLTYAHAQDVLFLNKAITYSAFALFLVQFLFIGNFFHSLARGARCADPNPWRATTLEWQAPTPPLPGRNFATPLTVHHGPCEYSAPGAEADFTPQSAAPAEARA